MQTERFEIYIPDEVLTDLKKRLNNTRWPDEIKGSGWRAGTDLHYLKELVNYWQDEYDWRKQEAMLNKFAHYKTEMNDVGIHFIHERGKGPNPLPIILSHGFPDSFMRYLKLIPMLTDPEAYGCDPNESFDVIVPSLPGYGFSGEPNRNGTLFHINDLWADLMKNVLGYQRYAAHGGDWGGIITEQLGRDHAEALVGIHLTDVPFIHSFQKPDNLTADEEKYLTGIEEWQKKEGAYAMIQGTRPQTLAAGLNDSPVALAAWLIEKFQSMSDCDGNPENIYTKDELITNVMIYWVTDTVLSSFSPYYTVVNAGALTWINEKIKEWSVETKPPAGFCFFAHENTHPPREWAERFFNVTHWTKQPHGGHFGAMEQPALLADDLRSFFRPLRENHLPAMFE